MKFSLRMIIVSLLSLILVTFFISCDDGSGSSTPTMDGTWTITTTPSTGTSVGSGSCTLTYYTSMTIFGNEINIYSGTGSLSGVTLSGAAAGSYTTNYGGSFTFYSSTDGDGDGDEDYLEFSFTGSLSDSISGTYGPDTDDSNNVFAGQTGTFTATKN